MREKLFFMLMCCILVIGLSGKLGAQNLLSGSDMESATAWTLASFNTADIEPVWGYKEDHPLSGTGGSLYLNILNVTDNSQFGIYQAVELTAGVTYTVDAAIKIIGQVKTSWLEVYVGTTDPATVADYAVPNGTALGTLVEGIAKIASYFSWWTNPTTPPNPNSTIQVGANQKINFTPTATGTYYFLFKAGSNAGGNAKILVDNLVFGNNLEPLVTAPKASFQSDKRVGFSPLTVNFESTSTNANTYQWFVDGTMVATTATPSYTFSSQGKYTVSLKVSNALGTDSIGTKDFISVMNPVKITAGGKIIGGNMEDVSKWSTSLLNSPLDLGESTALSTLSTTWDFSGPNTPTAGQGGALRIQIYAHGDDQVQYCIYQKVQLSSNLIYRFNGAFRDNSADLWRTWSEVYISDTAPVEGSDFGTTNGTRLAELSNWETKTGLVRGLDGTYQLNTTVAGYTPPIDGEYYLIYKVGVLGNGLTAANPGNTCDIIVDELSLTEISPKPYVDFSAENESGFSPLIVSFKNLTQYGETYEWDFGDGSTKSTSFEPTHTYTAIGDYTVQLKAVNANGDSTLTRIGFVSVVEPYELPDGEKLYGGNMEKGGFWKTSPYGQNLKSTVTWNYTDESFEGSVGGIVRVVNGRIAFYQPIEVKTGHVYKFDCDVKVKSSSTNMWIQTFMWETEPPQDEDVLLAANTMAELRTYADASVSGYEGKFSEKCIKGASYPYDKGTYKHIGPNTTMWFAIKLGTNSTMDILLDNLSLKEFVAPAEPDFTSFETEGDTPFRVEFFDLSDGAQSWLWDFGDGGTSSLQDPAHTYTVPGIYTVSLTVTNLDGISSTKTIEDYITVTGEAGVNNPLSKAYQVFSDNGLVHVTSDSGITAISIYDVRGMLIEAATTCNKNFRSHQLAPGLYILNINGTVIKTIVK